MIGDEPYAPYQRPPLSKKFLTERPPADTLYFRPEKFWGEQGVVAAFGVSVNAVDRAAKRVTFADGHAEYETLFLSTGTRARDLPIPGARLDGVFSLRKIDDVRALRGPMDAARHIVIVGGGYIGLEVAAVARSEGREVTVLEAEERVMKRVTSPVISRLHAGLSSDSRCRHPARRAARSHRGRREGVAGEIVGRHRIAGRSGAARGRRQAKRRSRGRGRPRLRGWRCSGRARPDRRSGDLGGGRLHPLPQQALWPQAAARMRAECDRSGQGGRVRAPREAATYDPVPWFWSDQYELKLQMAGLSDGYDDAKTVGDVAAARFSVEYRGKWEADRGRRRQRRPRLHERPQADCGGDGLS